MPVSKGVSLALALASGPALAGDVMGIVRYAGPEPNRPRLAVIRDETTCGEDVPDESLDVADGRLRNVVVTVKSLSGTQPKGVSGAGPAGPGLATIDQKACRFMPRVQVAGVGSTLVIRNSDPVFHNVHATLGDRQAFNIAMPLKNMKKELKLDRPGVLHARCDVHPWMDAFVVVTDGPHALVGADGSFAIRGLPAGTYRVTAWHEKLGEKVLQMTVPAAGQVRADFSLGR